MSPAWSNAREIKLACLALAFCFRIAFAENRRPLFRAML